MKKKELLNRTVKFKQEDFESHRELFKQISKAQSPHTLFVGCSDSRVVPNLITKALPGELFVVRNIANIIPPYRSDKDYFSTASAIEYAVLVLEVKNILVCGHSNCGGCNALYYPDEKLSKTPAVKKWLELALDVKKEVKNLGFDKDLAMREWITEQLNVVYQLKNLLTYPFVEERVRENRLNLIGWHYIIETGEVFNFNGETKTFELIK